MAFLAASGLDIPDELFKEKIEVTGSIGILEENITAGDEISVTVSFNVDVVAYEFSIIEVNSESSLLDLLTPNSNMDRPDFDEFQIEMSTPGELPLNSDTLAFVWTSTESSFIRVLKRSKKTLWLRNQFPLKSILMRRSTVQRKALGHLSPKLKTSSCEAKHKPSSPIHQPSLLNAPFNPFPKPCWAWVSIETASRLTVFLMMESRCE